MSSFYELLDLLYQINRKYPELRLGQIMLASTTSEENLFYMDDEELVKRLKKLLEEDN